VCGRKMRSSRVILLIHRSGPHSIRTFGQIELFQLVRRGA
jgi:hypothetical protein